MLSFPSCFFFSSFKMDFGADVLWMLESLNIISKIYLMLLLQNCFSSKEQISNPLARGFLLVPVTFRISHQKRSFVLKWAGNLIEIYLGGLKKK